MSTHQPTDFGPTTLPYCSFVLPSENRHRVGVGVGTDVLDLTDAPVHTALFAGGNLDALLAAGPDTWQAVRSWLLNDLPDGPRHRADSVELVMPFTVADYVDFYASEHHATNVGRIFRPDAEPLTPNWRHLPIGYHGRSGTISASGTDVVRPVGQRKAPDAPAPTFGPSGKLDIEAEVAYIVGVPTDL